MMLGKMRSLSLASNQEALTSVTRTQDSSATTAVTTFRIFSMDSPMQVL